MCQNIHWCRWQDQWRPVAPSRRSRARAAVSAGHRSLSFPHLFSLFHSGPHRLRHRGRQVDARPAAGQGAQGMGEMRERRQSERARSATLSQPSLPSLSSLGHRRPAVRQARPHLNHRRRRLRQAGHGQDGAAAGKRQKRERRGLSFWGWLPGETQLSFPSRRPVSLSLLLGLPHAQAEDRGLHGAGAEDAAHSGRGGAAGEALMERVGVFFALFRGARPRAGACGAVFLF